MVPSSAELAWICDHLREKIVDGSIQKIQQPTPTRFLISIFKPRAGKTRLFFDLEAKKLRFHPTEHRFANPADAPTLCRTLRKLLENGRIRSIEANGQDRIVHLVIEKMEDGRVHRRRLILEFIPSRPLLVIVGDDKKIEALSSGVHSEQRDLKRGLEYVEPAAPPTKDQIERAPFLRFDSSDAETILKSLDEELAPAVDKGQDRGALSRALTKALKRQVKRVSKIEQDWRRSEGGEDSMKRGELLKGVLHEIERGMTSIRVRDWTVEDEDAEGAWVDIDLDATLSPQENIERVFAQGKKKLRGQELVLERLEEQRERLATLNDLEARFPSLKSADDMASFAREMEALDIEIEAAPTRGANKKKAPPAPRKAYRVYLSKDGIEIWVGRGARDNDELTFRCARGNEWWLHAQDYAGSHVIVKTEAELPEQTLLDAATLAALNSKAGDRGRQSVSYTRRKNVQKFRGAAPGKVLLQSHRTIVVRMEEERIRRLTGQ